MSVRSQQQHQQQHQHQQQYQQHHAAVRFTAALPAVAIFRPKGDSAGVCSSSLFAECMKFAFSVKRLGPFTPLGLYTKAVAESSEYLVILAIEPQGIIDSENVRLRSVDGERFALQLGDHIVSVNNKVKEAGGRDIENELQWATHLQFLIDREEVTCPIDAITASKTVAGALIEDPGKVVRGVVGGGQPGLNGNGAHDDPWGYDPWDIRRLEGAENNAPRKAPFASPQKDPWVTWGSDPWDIRRLEGAENNAPRKAPFASPQEDPWVTQKKTTQNSITKEHIYEHRSAAPRTFPTTTQNTITKAHIYRQHTVVREYDPSLEPQSGYLQLCEGMLVNTCSMTAAPGDKLNLHSEYVYGHVHGKKEMEGWFPTAVLRQKRRVVRNYDPSLEPQPGYLPLGEGMLVNTYSMSETPGDKLNQFREYVYGYVDGRKEVEGWFPTAVLEQKTPGSLGDNNATEQTSYRGAVTPQL